MNNKSKKKTSVPYRRKRHDAYQHNVMPRLEGVVKNKGTKPARKKKTLSKKLEEEAKRYAQEQLEAPETYL